MMVSVFLCVSVVKRLIFHHRDTEDTKKTQTRLMMVSVFLCVSVGKRLIFHHRDTEDTKKTQRKY